MNIHKLLSMDAYGIYVWSAYSITLIVFSINLFLAMREKNAVKKIIRSAHLSQSSHPILKSSLTLETDTTQ